MTVPTANTPPPRATPTSPLNARAMLLAAGRGERMRPLTDTCPKPLLVVQGKPLMQWPLEALARGGVDHVVINTAWLGAQIEAKFGHHFGPLRTPDVRKQLSNQERSAATNASATAAATATLQLHYSDEGRDFGGALETAGGIVRALPLLGEVFWVLAGDVFAPDFVFDPAAVQRFVASGKLAHLWLVPNPVHNPRGDFGLQTDTGVRDSATPGADPLPGATHPARTCALADAPALALSLSADDPRPRYTYSTIGLYRAALFAPPWCDIPAGNPQGVKAALAPLLRAAMAQGQVSAELYTGRWTDVGTPERLQALNQPTGL